MLGNRAPLVLGLAALLVACGARRLEPAHAGPPAQAGASAAPHEAVARPLFMSPARVFPPLERSEVTSEARDSDGGRRFIAQGLRLIESPTGALAASDEFLPGSRVASTLELPARLGGGFLFVLNASGNALFWRASSWTGKLRPLARLDGEVERVVPGFDRLYALRARGAPWVALDADSGQALDLGSLPPSPGYGSMAFADEWFGVVELPLRGVLATFDAGGTWHPLGVPHAELATSDAGIVVATPSRRFTLAQSGKEEPLAEPQPPDTSRARERSPAPRLPLAPPFGARPLETAVLHGLPDEPGTALVAAHGALARVRLRDGAVLALVPDAYAGRAACDAVRLGARGGFVCGEPHGPTRVYALARGLALELVRQFDQPRRVAPNGRGALIVSGSCDPGGAEQPRRCILPSSGVPFELPVRDATERAVALLDGGVALLAPIAKKAKATPKTAPEQPAPSRERPQAQADEPIGTLTLVTPGTSDRVLALRLSGVEDALARSIVMGGFWLDSLELDAEGDISGWVAGGDSFVGVRIKLDGRVLVGAPEQHLDRALLAGRFALVVGRSGALRESVDGGFDWSDAELPAEPDLRQLKTSGTPSGCTELGCAVGGWLRVGWKMGERDRLSIAAVPEPTHLLGSGGNRWSLQCEASGEQSRPALRQSPQNEERAASPWNPLAEIPPPSHAKSELGLETGNEIDLRLFRAYAWGPAGDGWSRDARWLVRVRDPYRVSDAIWSTAATPSAWSSAVLASDSFGRSPSGPPSTWRIVTDPIRHAALLVVSTRGALELYLLEEGKNIARIKFAGALGVITSVARAGGTFYVAALGEGRSLRLFQLDHGVLEQVGEFPDVAARADAPALAPATQGEGIGLWVHDADYYLFPFDPNARRFDAPLVTRASALAAMPAACSTAEDGYVVGDALSLEPNVELSGVGAGIAPGNGIEVRLIVAPTHVCAESVAAPLGSPMGERRRFQDAPPVASPVTRPGTTGIRTPSSALRGDGPPGSVSGRDASAGAPLVLSSPDGSRRGFRCRD